MRKWPALIAWILTAALGIAVVAVAFPRVYLFYPEDWTVTKQRAIDLALESFRELGDPVEDAYVVAALYESGTREKRLLKALKSVDRETLLASSLADRHFGWQVTVYGPGVRPGEWTYKAIVGATGKLTSLRLRVPPEEEAAAIEPAAARREADRFLELAGVAVSRYDEPTTRRVDLQARTDLSLRYRDRQALLGEDTPYGFEVTFAGDRLTGFERYIEDPDEEALISSFQLNALLGNAWIMVPFLLFPFVAFFFLRRYHAGEVGVRRAIQVFAVVFGAGALQAVLTASASTEGNFWGVLSRAQVTWASTSQLVIFWFPVVALVAALSWSVGEVRCREKRGEKLAAFDALFQRRWHNATVARSSLRGFALGMALAAALFLGLLAVQPLGVDYLVTQITGPWWQHASWSGLTLPLFVLVIRLYADLFALLFLLPWVVPRLGVWLGGALVAIVQSALFWPPFMTDPPAWFVVFSLLRAAAVIAIFLRYDLLTALLASIGAAVMSAAPLFLLADAPFLVLQGVLPAAALAVPLLLSARYLRSDREFTYRYEDVPPHVRRIAERERQRVELETARRIQSSILPELPPRLAGCDLAHCYLPASEVGGDFYDVLALDDGRLAVAVGDVAGHGVSSGLIMSMAKSTLALQVTVDPEVESVLTTLNRTVYQSARLRLLTTLCYALVDRSNRELTYASAGHLAPYRLDASGNVQALHAASYPLGVRGRLDVRLRRVHLDPGDRLFLFSDGVVEARRDGSDELFGFERLEESLRRHAGRDVGGLRDGVLDDLNGFTGGAEREDDQTILVLRVP